MISFGERCYSNQYDKISDDEFSDDEISGFANMTKFLTTKFLTTKFLATKFPPPGNSKLRAFILTEKCLLGREMVTFGCTLNPQNNWLWSPISAKESEENRFQEWLKLLSWVSILEGSIFGPF